MKDDFFKHWISMLISNPRTFFEAWELQTCGFWAINQSYVLSSEVQNIAWGVPRNLHPEYAADLDITFENKLVNEQWYALFPSDEWSIPVSVINWVLIYLALCLMLCNKKQWVLALIPSFGLMLTLLLASPIFYWPRYEAATQFLIPFYIALGMILVLPSCDIDTSIQKRIVN